MKKLLTIFLFILFLLQMPVVVMAQNAVVTGIVRNKTDRQPLSSVNVYFKNTTVGAQTDENGIFTLAADSLDRRLVFSCVGFRMEEIKVKGGMSAWIQVEMQEEDILLSEVFVLPGVNPALDLLRRVRLMRNKNDIVQKSWYQAVATTENLFLLNRLEQKSINSKIFEQLRAGNIAESDTSLVLPIFMQKSIVNVKGKNFQTVKDSTYSSKPEIQNLTRQITSQIDRQIDFYANSITLFDKAMISPLSAQGTLYYEYFLRDSIWENSRKLYEVSFRTKNRKNLAFIGTMKIDSATLAIAEIEAALPKSANLNFVNSLNIYQSFSPDSSGLWFPHTETVEFSMIYELFADSLHPRPQALVKRSSRFNTSDIAAPANQDFAQSSYSTEHLDKKLDNLNNTPVMRTARWLADIVLTGYVPAWIFDFGKVENFARLTDIEGFRLTLPLRTNERLFKNFSLEGYLGYGFKNQKIAYSFSPAYRLPLKRFHSVNINYTKDYRKINYDYNNFLLRENPLQSGDEDISSSIISLKTSSGINLRQEISVLLTNNWTDDIESRIVLRNNTLYANNWLPMVFNNSEHVFSDYMQYTSLTLALRYSFGENTFLDHVQQIYAPNTKPVIYMTGEFGKYDCAVTGLSGDNKFFNFSAVVRQNINTPLGRFRYLAEAGMITGNVPYPLLEIVDGNQGGGYSFYRFGLMNRMEYAANRYAHLHTEMLFNGILFNQISLVKYLNFREIITFKASYGKLNNNFSDMAFPENLSAMNGFYAEAGIGVANILRFLNIQSVWRLTDRNKPNVRNWGILMSVMITF